MITITQSVGRGGRAKRGNDVLKIQKLLNQAGARPQLVPDSSIGTKTIREIERYQSTFMKRPDGRIDPDGETMRRLNGKAATTTSFRADFDLRNSRAAEFRKFDDPTRGYRGDTKGLRLPGGRQFVLRGCSLDTFRGPIRNWVDKNIVDGVLIKANISVRQIGGGLDGRFVDFVNAIPVSLDLKKKSITIAFSYFVIGFDKFD